MQLDNKVALVTGGAVRLGRAMALALAARGVRVAITYYSSADSAQGTLADIRNAGVDGCAIQADLAKPNAAGRVVERVITHFGQLDILINNAAIFETGFWDSTTVDNWDRHFAINLRAPFFLAQAFAQYLERSRPGHIVNIADWRGARPGVDHVAYTLTKAGLIAMTSSLALALAPTIQVNAIAPGIILPPPGTDQDWLERHLQSVPAQRSGSPEEIAHTLLYLLESEFVTGDIIEVTGGQHL